MILKSTSRLPCGAYNTILDQDTARHSCGSTLYRMQMKTTSTDSGGCMRFVEDHRRLVLFFPEGPTH